MKSTANKLSGFLSLDLQVVVKEHHPAGHDGVCSPIIPAFKKIRQEDYPSSNKTRLQAGPKRAWASWQYLVSIIREHSLKVLMGSLLCTK